MKKSLKIILIVLVILVGIVVLDTLQAKIFNNSPLIKIREDFNGGNTYYIDKGIFVNHYYCSNKEEKTIFKGTKFNCSSLQMVGMEVKEIVDTSKDIRDFVCSEALEEFYRDDNYIYYYNCIKSKYIIVRYTNGFEETVLDALKKGTITIKDLDRYNINYIKQENENNEKEVLKLGYREVLGKDFEGNNPSKSNKINIKYFDIPEMEIQKYNNNSELKEFSDYINKTFNITLDDNWTFFIKYYDENKTVGMIEFIYTIGEINTNKSIIFNLNNGIADVVYYKCLDDKINEEEILSRLNKFKEKYIQEKKVFKDDEKFQSEKTNYTYYINADTLVYNYVVYFSYGSFEVINNDYGTVRIIDSNGNATR